MKKGQYILIIILISFIGCFVYSYSFKQEDVAREYLQKQGYEIVQYYGMVDRYILSEEKLMQMPYMMYWGLQKKNPEMFIGEKVYVEKFKVQNHPLDNWQSISKLPENVMISKGRSIVWVYVVENLVVGGHSYPDLDRDMIGWVWSLEGKTLEEVHSVSFKVWLDKWEKQFGDGD